jgi:hypothetical protein
MSRLIGGLLAFFAIFSAFAGVPLASGVFGLLTLVWILAAKPVRRDGTTRQVDRWGNVY